MNGGCTKALLNELGHGSAVNGFMFEQCFGNEVQPAAVFEQRDAGSLFLFAQNARDLVVDFPCRVVAVFATRGHEIFAEEHLLLPLPGHRPNGIAHAPFAHHASGN